MLCGVKEYEKNLDHIEVMLAKDEELAKVLRLLCLQSVVKGGLKEKVIDRFKRQILLVTLHHYIILFTSVLAFGTSSPSPTSRRSGSSISMTAKMALTGSTSLT